MCYWRTWNTGFSVPADEGVKASGEAEGPEHPGHWGSLSILGMEVGVQLYRVHTHEKQVADLGLSILQSMQRRKYNFHMVHRDHKILTEKPNISP